MQGMSDNETLYPEKEFDEDLKMLANIKPSYIGRAAGWWGMTWDTPSDLEHFARAKRTAQEVHKILPETILEAAVFEYASQNINNIRIPDWVYLALNEPTPTTPRNFVFKDIVYDDYETNTHHQWNEGKKSGAVDITKPEAKRWFMYRAGSYIQAGFEALHLGQVELMGELDPTHQHWWLLAGKIRQFAEKNALRKKVLLNGHTHGFIVNTQSTSQQLVFDLHAAPLRPNPKKRCLFESKENMPAKIELGFHDSIYKKSIGGVTPSGYSVNANPYFVEFDNYGISDHPGEYRKNDWMPWGYDEITWFSLLTKKERTKFIQYAVEQIRNWDALGSLMVAGRRGTTRPGVPWPGVTYRANLTSEWSDEETIRTLWKQEN